MSVYVHIISKSKDAKFLDAAWRDPATYSPFKEGDRVVVCGKCTQPMSVQLEQTWQEANSSMDKPPNTCYICKSGISKEMCSLNSIVAPRVIIRRSGAGTTPTTLTGNGRTTNTHISSGPAVGSNPSIGRTSTNASTDTRSRTSHSTRAGTTSSSARNGTPSSSARNGTPSSSARAGGGTNTGTNNGRGNRNLYVNNRYDNEHNPKKEKSSVWGWFFVIVIAVLIWGIITNNGNFQQSSDSGNVEPSTCEVFKGDFTWHKADEYAKSNYAR